MKKYTFDALLIKHDTLDSAYIEIPFDVEKEFGKKGQIKVVATFDKIEYRGSIAKMGRPCYFIGLNKEIRDKVNKQPGETIQVTIQEDLAPRVVEIPEDFKKMLEQHTPALEIFEKLSYTHKKEYVRWITEAKKEETRSSRLQKSIALLTKGTKTPL